MNERMDRWMDDGRMDGQKDGRAVLCVIVK